MLTLKAAHVEFIKFLKNKKRATATILAYGKDIEQLVKFLIDDSQKNDLEQISSKDLENFMTRLAREGYTPKSISRKTNSTKTFFNFLKSQQHLVQNPALALSHPKYETKNPRILSKMEYRSLRDACRTDIRVSSIVEILLQTGIRISELANLKMADIRFSEGQKTGQLTIQAYESHPLRVIPLNKAAENALKNYLAIRPQTSRNSLFVTKTGRPLLVRNIRTAIDRYFRLAGVKEARVNDLRHTFIAHQLMSGTSLVTVSKLAGHKRLTTTEKYLSLIQGKTEENIKLGEL